MILQQYYLECLAHASYLVVDEVTKKACVIDPRRDVDLYLAEAERLGVTIEHVLLTHFHADFIAGHLELRDRVGARIHLGAKAEAEYPFTGLADGDELELGSVRLRALETPGHTPEGISILVFDLEKDATKPYAVFTGDTLFVGDVGRPDLMASVGVSAEELAGSLYDSLHGRLLTLPDETLVYPAHGAGSMCGRNLGTETFTTIGDQRQLNYALQPMTREEFVRIVTANQPQAPAYFGYDAVMNKKERGLLGPNLERVTIPLSLAEVLALQAEGAQLLDVRDATEFARAHLAGSVNIGLGGKFATWAGTLLSPEAPIVLVAVPGTEREAAMRLGRIGLDRVAGYLDGGPGAFPVDSNGVVGAVRGDARSLEAELGGEEAPFVLDVRTESEWETGHIEGSENVPLQRLQERVDELPRDRRIAIVCKSGYRSSTAGSLLRREGFADLVDLEGGMDRWQEESRAVVGESGTCASASQSEE